MLLLKMRKKVVLFWWNAAEQFFNPPPPHPKAFKLYSVLHTDRKRFTPFHSRLSHHQNLGKHSAGWTLKFVDDTEELTQLPFLWTATSCSPLLRFCRSLASFHWNSSSELSSVVFSLNRCLRPGMPMAWVGCCCWAGAWEAVAAVPAPAAPVVAEPLRCWVTGRSCW